MTDTQLRRTAASASSVRGSQSGWTVGRASALVLGVVLVLVSLALLAGGGTALWADRTQREGGFVTSDPHSFSSRGSALVTEPIRLGSAGVGWLYSPSLLGGVRIRVTPEGAAPGVPLFVGIGRAADVDRYLAGVRYTLVSDFWDGNVELHDGSAAAIAPAEQSFWVASSVGAGSRTLVWEPKSGSWSVVVMNADGRPGIAVTADLGARMPAVLWVAVGVVGAGAVLLACGALLLVGARRGRGGRAGRAAGKA